MFFSQGFNKIKRLRQVNKVTQYYNQKSSNIITSVWFWMPSAPRSLGFEKGKASRRNLPREICSYDKCPGTPYISGSNKPLHYYIGYIMRQLANPEIWVMSRDGPYGVLLFRTTMESKCQVGRHPPDLPTYHKGVTGIEGTLSHPLKPSRKYVPYMIYS